MTRLDPDRAWRPTSPSGPLFENTLENIARAPDALHDVHGPWEYQGLTEQYTLYNQGRSLFHSEFGVEGYTNQRVLEAHIAPANRWPATRDNPVYFHTAAWWIKEATLQAAFGALPDLRTTVRASQFLQFEGLRYALEANRRRKYHNSGSLPWQFNEPYPNAACTSAVDYHAQPKPVYYAVARAYACLALSARFATQAWAGREMFEAEVWLCNSGAAEARRAVHLQMRILGVDGTLHENRLEEVFYGPNRAVRLAHFRWPLAELAGDIFFFDLELQAPDGSRLAGNRYLFTNQATLASLLSLPLTRLSIDHRASGAVWQIELRNTGHQAAIGLWLEDDRQLDAAGGVYFSDNYLLLLPGESRAIAAEWQNVPERQRRLQVQAWNAPSVILSSSA